MFREERQNVLTELVRMPVPLLLIIERLERLLRDDVLDPDQPCTLYPRMSHLRNRYEKKLLTGVSESKIKH